MAILQAVFPYRFACILKVLYLGGCPFSFGDIFYGLVVSWLIWKIWRLVKAIYEGTISPEDYIVENLVSIACIVMQLYISFLICFGELIITGKGLPGSLV